MILENHLAKIEVKVKDIKDIDITKLSKDSIILDPNNYLDENYPFKKTDGNSRLLVSEMKVRYFFLKKQ